MMNNREFLKSLNVEMELNGEKPDQRVVEICENLLEDKVTGEEALEKVLHL